MELIGLTRLVDVVGGKNFTRFIPTGDKNLDTDVKTITSKAIEDGLISPSEIGTEKFKADILKDESYLTKKGDILLKLTSPFDAAIVTEEFDGHAYPAVVACLRPSADVTGTDIYYLLAYFNSKEAKAKFSACASGRFIPILSLGPLRDMMIPFPESKIRDEIGANYIKYLKCKSLTKKIFALEKEKNDSYFGNIVESDGNYNG